MLVLIAGAALTMMSPYTRETARTAASPVLPRREVAPPSEAGAIYDGRARQLTVHVPRLAADIPVDGTLDAPVWRQAALLCGFSEYTPVDGPPAEDSTEVLVWYSPKAMYFGVRAFEAHGAVHGVLADRDKIDADDNVALILSPFIHGRQALVFAVNPLGIQEDGTITEGTSSNAFSFGVANHAGRPPTDLSPDFVFESKGHLTPMGYEVVIRIPFRSVKYQSIDPQDWGLNIVRKVQHSGHESTWVPTVLAASSFLAQSGTLAGLTGLERGLVLDLNPFVTERANGYPRNGPSGSWYYGVQRPQFGGNARWGITNNLTLNGTYRPDFAEVESDATQVQYDPRVAIFYPEKRPFFLDGLEQFNTPSNLVYTRRLLAPVAAAKLTGKLSDVTVAYMSAQDAEGSPSAGGGGRPLFNILRVQRDVGDASQIGVVATDREDGGTFNRVAGVDARFTFGDIYSVAVQAAGSSTRDVSGVLLGSAVKPATAAGPLWDAHFIRSGRSFGLDYSFTGIDPEFVASSGFISRSGVANMFLDHNYTLYGAPNAFVETFTADFGILHTWVYRHLTAAQAPEDRRWHFTGTAKFHGGWQLGGAIYLETYGYDPALYANYYLGHLAGSGTSYTHFVGQTLIPNTDYVIQFATPQFATFSFSIVYISGRDENFFEWATADIGNTNLTASWRPTDKLRLNGTYIANLYHRHSDGSLVERQLIPRLDAEYQLSRPIFFRIIGQYIATRQDSLRDDSRTNLPIFFRDPATGTFTRATAFEANQFQVSGLFAYQPVPGTVAFIGYGNALTESTPFHFFGLRRAADNFFVKFSYLFRL